MKKHAIIPIFIPHLGCSNDCVFCNQKIITAKQSPVTVEDSRKQIETYLSTLRDSSVDTIEIAFYGGSFTGLNMSLQNKYLQLAQEYKEAGTINKIHLSTRPDYINYEILENLKNHSVDIIELGVQSFDDDVLKKSKRGHNADQVFKAVELIKSFDFTLGIQLMIGLPGDTKEKCIESAKKAASLHPSLARLYPTIVFPDTELAEMYKQGQYTPFSEDDTIEICKEMYRILHNADINIMRVGLKSTDLVSESSDLSSSYHPAFRQLVESSIAKEDIENALVKALDEKFESGISIEDIYLKAVCRAHSRSFSNMIGHNGINKNYFKEKYPNITLKFICDCSIKEGVYSVDITR